MMDAIEWPRFPARLLEAPAEEWGGLPAGGIPRADEEGEEALLAQLEDAFASDRGGHQDRAMALKTIKMFLATRRVRLLEDLLLLSTSLGDNDGGSVGSGSAAVAPHRPDQAARSSSTVADLRRELAIALEATASLKSPVAGGVEAGTETTDKKIDILLGGESRGAAAEALRAASCISTEEFFAVWAERFRMLLVPLGVGGEGAKGVESGGGGGAGSRGGSRKDDREIQAARDVERDMLSVNGTLVKGSEGYDVVVGKVRRELARLVEPVAGPDRVGGTGRPAAAAAAARARGRGPQLRSSPSPPLSQGEAESLPLRPSHQLQNFSKLVLKAANRTESGGLSFDAIHRIMALCPSACDGSVMVVPDSSKAEPLGIDIKAESFKQRVETPFAPLERNGVPELLHGLHTFGICAHVKAVTVYSLYSADMERVHLRLRATFQNSLRLPISPFSTATCQAFSDVEYSGENGEVQIEVLEGTHDSQLA